MRFVSVVVVNWNGEHLLNACLGSLRNQTYGNFETIVVDNGSTDGSIPFLREHAPDVRLVRLAENTGFAGGNIESLRIAKGEYIALLNNDAVAEPRWLSELVSAMDGDGRVGICASKVLMHDRPDLIDSAGDGCATSGHGFKRGHREPASNYTRKEHVFGACAAAALYRKTMIEEIGFLDRDFFLNCEDTDLNFRAQLMGWKCLYVPSAVVLHRVTASIGVLSDIGVYYSARNDEYVWVKNMPAALMLRYFHHKVVQEFGVFIYFCLKRGKWRSFFLGKLDAIRMLPQLWRKRRAIQRDKKVENAYLRTVLTSVFDSGLIKGKLKRLFSLNGP